MLNLSDYWCDLESCEGKELQNSFFQELSDLILFLSDCPLLQKECPVKKVSTQDIPLEWGVTKISSKDDIQRMIFSVNF